MRPAIAVQRHHNGPRLYLFGHRAHHGATGAVLAAAGAAAVVIGCALMVHDRRDSSEWWGSR